VAETLREGKPSKVIVLGKRISRNEDFFRGVILAVIIAVE